MDVVLECEGEGCRKAKPGSRVCSSDIDWDCVIGKGVNDNRVYSDATEYTNEVEAAISLASIEINDRKFEGTDYTSEVKAVIEIYRSEFDKTVIAYAVIGGGCGEPDYCDQLIYGINLDGEQVYFEEDSW